MFLAGSRCARSVSPLVCAVLGGGCVLLTPSLPGAECGFLLNMAFLIPS